VGELLSLDREDIEKCTEAYEYFIGHSTKCGTAGCESSGDTMAETEHVRAYYKVINYLLSIADIEKMYIPPQLDAKKGLYANQLLTEAMLAESLQCVHSCSSAALAAAVDNTTDIRCVFHCFDPRRVGNASTLLDIGCGRGRIAHHMAALTGGHVKGFNIDESQINNAIEYAKGTGMEERLDFRVGDHHQPFQYADRSFDGAYSFQAVW
jgi:sterol 24-C-methyltransferase